MEINVLCFSIYGNQERTAWAGITIEDGDVSEFSGVANSALQAILFGLYECLETLPSPTPIMIRSSDRLPNDVGKKWIPQWKAQGFQHEEHKADIQLLLSLITPKKCLWSKPVLVNDMDRKAQKLAKECFALLMSSSVTEEARQTNSTVVGASIQAAPSQPVCSPLEEEASSPIPETLPSPTPPKESEHSQSIDSLQQKPVTSEESPLESSVPTSSPPDFLKDDPSTIPAEIPQLLFQAQILVYIDAISTGNIGSWGFLLIDRKSQQALLKASGHRHSHYQTNLLQACISSLQALHSPDFLIEIRSRHQSFIQLGQQWLPLWARNSWKKRNGEEPANLPFIQELHRVLQTMTPAWRYIPEQSEERGLLDCHRITQQALNQLNDGGKAQIEHRIPRYPIEKLV